MEQKKNPRGLGKGLDALLGGYEPQEREPTATLSVHLIDINASQPRKQFDETKLDELAKSIERHGVVQPIIVRKNGARYTIVAGERRYRAARRAGLTEVPVIVRELDDEQVLEVALIENLQREDLNPIETAAAIKFLMEQHDLTQEEVSKRLGKSRPAIANTVRLLSLPEPIRELLRGGAIQAGHARVLASIPEDALMCETAAAAAKNGWSVRETEARVEALLKAKNLPKRQPKTQQSLSNDLSSAQESLRERLGTKVSLKGSEKKGRIVIEYYSSDELNDIFDTIMGVRRV